MKLNIESISNMQKNHTLLEQRIVYGAILHFRCLYKTKKKIFNSPCSALMQVHLQIPNGLAPNT